MRAYRHAKLPRAWKRQMIWHVDFNNSLSVQAGRDPSSSAKSLQQNDHAYLTRTTARQSCDRTTDAFAYQIAQTERLSAQVCPGSDRRGVSFRQSASQLLYSPVGDVLSLATGGALGRQPQIDIAFRDCSAIACADPGAGSSDFGRPNDMPIVRRCTTAYEGAKLCVSRRRNSPPSSRVGSPV